jgi:hypothetical protein
MKIDGRKRKRTPEELERLKSVGRKKGDPKVPGSGVKAIPDDVKEALKARTMDAVETLYDVMQNSSNDNARVKAAAYFLDPFIPKAAQTIDVNHKHSIADLLTQANQMRLKDDSKPMKDITPIAVETIDITPVAVDIIEPNTSPKLRVSSQRSADND